MLMSYMHPMVIKIYARMTRTTRGRRDGTRSELLGNLKGSESPGSGTTHPRSDVVVERLRLAVLYSVPAGFARGEGIISIAQPESLCITASPRANSRHCGSGLGGRGDSLSGKSEGRLW